MALVLPGQKLGTELEIASGDWTYLSKGEVIAMVAGQADLETRKANIKPFRHIKKIETGQEVIGQVMDIIEPIALVAITLPTRDYANDGSYAVLHISNIKNEYLANIRNAIRIGDIIFAKVIAVGKSIELSIKEPKYGVISAYSKVAKAHMKQKNGNTIICPKTGHTENRKLSILYGKFDEVLKCQKQNQK